MSASVTVAGLTDVLRPEHLQYENALNAVAKTMEIVVDVMNGTDFETMEGWKLKKSNKIDKVYSKRFEFGKIFTLRTEFEAPREHLFSEHWDNFKETAYLNKNTSFAEKVVALTPNVEIIHYAMKSTGVIKGRDFVTCRMYRRIDGDIFEAARSIDIDGIEIYRRKVRGNLILGGGRFRVHPQNPERTIVDYLICLDFNGPDLTKPVVESTLSKYILQDAQWAREQIEKVKSEENAK